MNIFCRSEKLKRKGESGATEDLVTANFSSRDFPQTLGNLASKAGFRAASKCFTLTCESVESYFVALVTFAIITLFSVAAQLFAVVISCSAFVLI